MHADTEDTRDDAGACSDCPLEMYKTTTNKGPCLLCDHRTCAKGQHRTGEARVARMPLRVPLTRAHALMLFHPPVTL